MGREGIWRHSSCSSPPRAQAERRRSSRGGELRHATQRHELAAFIPVPPDHAVGLEVPGGEPAVNLGDCEGPLLRALIVLVHPFDLSSLGQIKIKYRVKFRV